MAKKDKLDIKTKQTGFPPKDVTKIEMRTEFIIGSGKSSIFWRGLNNDNEQVSTGNLDIPSEIHNQWVVDNTIIENYVLTQLKLERK